MVAEHQKLLRDFCTNGTTNFVLLPREPSGPILTEILKVASIAMRLQKSIDPLELYNAIVKVIDNGNRASPTSPSD